VQAEISPETELERQITTDPEWIEGAAWGSPRPGHPEGKVATHIADVLQNVDRVARNPDEREKLRLIALVHDTFKHRVDPTRPRSGPNNHAVIARRFAERYISDTDVLDVIELHDEAFNAWAQGARGNDWDVARRRTERLVERLGPRLDLYRSFYRADNETGSKAQEPLLWFDNHLVSRPPAVTQPCS
jgi:hypothetical protein